ncbi:MAG: hypothetical protein LBC84_07535 [Prevotellaceae bacterium]|jgi:hypothetical protein|nr:hypothetical protein [Prevotellaceae bacterium]
MEPEEIKKMWQENVLIEEKQQISDLKINEMLKNQGKSALAKLIKTANFYRFAIIPLGLLFCLLSHLFFVAGGYYPVYPLLFLLICILLEPLEIYLYRLLKGIDFSTMPVKEVSERILKYHHILRKCEMYGIVIGVIYLSIWYYLYYKLTFGSEIVWVIIIFMIVMCMAVGFFVPSAYKKLYYRHINQINESLRELKEFDESNDNEYE